MTSTERPSIVWFRQDLRTVDNPALEAAVAREAPIVPLFIWSPDEERRWEPGTASRWWLHHSLTSLAQDLARLSLQLILRAGKTMECLQEILMETEASHLFWNRRYEPWAIERDAAIKARFHNRGLQVRSFNSALLFEPWTVANRQGKPFQVFTPFWRACQELPAPAAPLPVPSNVRYQAPALISLKLEKLKLLPSPTLSSRLDAIWKPGTKQAHALLKKFLEAPITHYAENRDRPDLKAVSRLSPYLHFGEISPRTIWRAVKARQAQKEDAGSLAYLRQLGWREFAHHILFHFPHTVDKPLQPKFAAFPWQSHKSGLREWQQGQTGFPIIDAGMRQLRQTGWMHNRVRMLVGSFLVKDLLLPWQEGARWFWETLVDADMANNSLGWQWVAGCGADPAPYFRVFNPVLQGKKFDPDGAYVKKWVPELANLPLRWLHEPWEAPNAVLREANISLGDTYPKPILNHEEARQRALAALKTLKE